MSKTEDTVSTSSSSFVEHFFGSFPVTLTPKMLSALIELTKSSTFDTDIGDESGFVQLDIVQWTTNIKLQTKGEMNLCTGF